MGNINCSDNICSENLFEISWISPKNWDIKYKYDKIENPYILNKGNFKLINNGYCKLSLCKKIDFEYDIEKILINFQFDFKLKKNNNIELFFILSDDLINLESDNNKNIIHKIKFTKNNIYLNQNNYKLNNCKMELLINFSYLNYILNNLTLKKKGNILLNLNNTIDYDKKKENIYFCMLIKSNIFENDNMDNYLNIKIL